MLIENGLMNSSRLISLMTAFSLVQCLLCATAQVSQAAASGIVFAQTVTPAPNVVSGRTYGFEIGLVCVLFAGALFAICRSSNRHT